MTTTVVESRAKGINSRLSNYPIGDVNLARNVSPDPGVPALALDFTTGSLDPRITSSRLASGHGGTYFDSNGVLQTAKVNLLLQSNAFTTSWINITGTDGCVQGVIGIDGLASGWTSTDDSASNVLGRTQSVSLTAGTYTLSVFIKKTSGAQASYPVLGAFDGSTNIALATIDTTNGVATKWTAYTGLTIITSSATCASYNSNYWRVSLTFAATTASWACRVYVAPINSETKSTGVFDGTVMGSVSFTNAQLETGSVASPYIMSTTAAAAAPRFESSGLLIEEQRTNYCLQSQDMSAAAWNTKTNISVGTNSVAAPDGNITADTLTATAGNAIITQGIATTAVSWTFSIFLKRKTGTGNIDITMDGTTWVTQTINATTWTRVTVTQTGVAGTSNCGIRIVSNGDEVYAWGGQAE